MESGSIPEITIEAKQIPDKECFRFVKDMKTGWNLGNTLDAYSQGKMCGDDISSEEIWGNPVTTKEMIDTLKNTGFRTVRIPVTWHNHVTDDGNGRSSVKHGLTVCRRLWIMRMTMACMSF